MMEKLLGLPVLASEEGRGVDDLIFYVHLLMFVLFVGWLSYFLYTVWRFRQPRHARADHHGVRSHVSNYLELAVAGIEAVLLFGLAIPMWARVNDRRGPRALIGLIAALSLAIPSLALVASLLPLPTDWERLAFGAVFFALAAMGAGGFMGFTNYLLAIAPEPQRPLYIGILNTLFAVTTLLPMLGGVVVKLASFQAVFGVAAGLGLAGVAVTLRLPAADPPG